MQFPNLHKFPCFAYDTETTGLVYKVDKVFGFSISTPDNKDYYYDIRETPKAVKWINNELKIYKGKIVMHHAAFDIRMSAHTGIYIPMHRAVCTVILACCVNEHEHLYELDHLCRIHLGTQKDTTIYREMANLFGGLATRNVQIGRIWKAPSHIVAPYAKLDTRLTLDLFNYLLSEVKEQKLQDIVKFELSKMPMFIEAGMKGIRVDLDYTEKAMKKLTPIINKEQKMLNKIAGQDINVDSPLQLKEELFKPVRDHNSGGWKTKDGIPIGTTDKDGPSITASILRGMDHPAAKSIIRIRSLKKLKDTFLRKHVLEHAVDGVVYPSINQSKGEDGGTGTGRLSYTDPALQQIPNKDKTASRIIKQCFLPDKGQVWVDCDLASFEVRVFAHLINNKEIIKLYRDNPHVDFHQMVAEIMDIVRDAEYTGQVNAKQLNLSMIFNSGKGAIAEKLGLPWEWSEFHPRGQDEKVRYKKPGPYATQLINAYHTRLPGIRELAENCQRVAEQRGYIFTSVGRHLRFPDYRFCYKASGLLIQATSADINKENWVIIRDRLNGHGRLLLNSHDSYSMSIEKDWKPHYERVKKGIERDRLRVPLILDWSGTGKNWHQALQGVDNASKPR